MLRIAILVVSAAATAAQIGRRAVQQRVAERKRTLVKEIAAQAREQTRNHARRYITDGCLRMGRNLLIRMAVLALALSGYFIGWLDGTGFIVVISAALTALLIRDLIMIYPTVRLALFELRKHGWRPVNAVREVVAAAVFDRVLEEASAEAPSAGRALMLKFAGECHDDIARDIATEVAAFARETSFGDILPIVAWRFGGMLIISALYTAFLLVAINMAH